MERLTRWIDEQKDIAIESKEATKDECLKKLADYEDAEEDGRLIEFPVAIGDHVWCFPSEAEPYREMQVIGLSCDFGAKYVQVQDVITAETVYFNTENLGKSMFISREQAEAKLKEMEDSNARLN